MPIPADMSGPTDWDWQSWWSSPRWPVRLPLRSIGGPGFVIIFQGVLLLGLILLGLGLSPKHDVRNVLPILAFSVVLSAVLAAVGLKQWSLLRRASYLELGEGEATLVAPAFLKEPWVIPRGAVASLTVHNRKRRVSALLPPRPAAPIPSITTFAGGPNLTLLLGRVLSLPQAARSRVVRPTGIADTRAWSKAGRPLAGIRLRLADPAAAEPALRAWLPQASDPAQPEPGATPPGFVSEARTRLYQRRTMYLGSLALVMLLAVAPFTHRPSILAGTALWGAVAWTVLWLLMRWALRLRRDVFAKLGIATIVLVLLVLIGLLERTGPEWLLLGTTLGGVLATVLAEFESQSRQPMG